MFEIVRKRGHVELMVCENEGHGTSISFFNEPITQRGFQASNRNLSLNSRMRPRYASWKSIYYLQGSDSVKGLAYVRLLFIYGQLVRC